MWTKVLAALGLKHGHHKLSAEDSAFMAHLEEYGKSYGTIEEYEFRKNIFTKNMKFIEEHNNNPENTHTVGINHLATWTEMEYKQLLGYKLEKMPKNKPAPEILPSPKADSIDWTTKGAVTKVKNQGQCGSCWAFSTTGSIEGAEFLHGTKKLTSLSEQQLVDCSKANDACKGGLMDRAFEYVEKTPLMTEDAYPYTGKHYFFSHCKYEEGKGVGHVKSYKDVQPKQADQLRSALENGPVSVAIEADKSAFQLYHGGVITGRGCGTNLDHGVLAVGYGTSDDG